MARESSSLGCGHCGTTCWCLRVTAAKDPFDLILSNFLAWLAHWALLSLPLPSAANSRLVLPLGVLEAKPHLKISTDFPSAPPVVLPLSPELASSQESLSFASDLRNKMVARGSLTSWADSIGVFNL